MKHEDLYSMLHDLYKNNQAGQRPSLLAIGWEADSAQIVQLASIDFDLYYARTVSEALRRLRSGEKAEVVLLNTSGGYDIYVATAALRLYTTAPIVLLFNDEKPVSPAFAVDAGADDWLPADIHPREFTARLYARIRRHRFNQRPFSVFGHPEQLSSNLGVKQPRPLV